MSEFALSLRDIVKTFPGVRALDSASLSVRVGEVHGLVGENGAGKSTIIKVLAGVYTPDSGSLQIFDSTIRPITPQTVHDAGVRFIHQELHLVPHFTVVEAVFMGQEISGLLGIDQKEMHTRTQRFFTDTLGVDIDPNALIADLGTAERKLVQIARALVDQQARIVVFDEPTAPLANDEVGMLMAAIARLKEQGISILYVSHYLNEITDLCDRVTVFRNGKDVAVFDDIHDATGAELISAMVGRDLADIFPARSEPSGQLLLEIDGLSGPGFADVSLRVGRGEIVGIAGLIGSGREELIDTLYGLMRPTTGHVRLNGSLMRIQSPADAVDQGVVLVPRDRRNDGLVLPMTVAENITLATLEEVSRFGIINGPRGTSRSETQIKALDIRPKNANAISRLLSGGNQQKVVIGRWLTRSADVFLLDEPTVGVDIGARAEIYALISRLANEGAGIVVSSSDPGELLGLCNRIAIMMRGEMVDVLDAKALDLDTLIAATTGARSAAEGTPAPEMNHG